MAFLEGKGEMGEESWLVASIIIIVEPSLCLTTFQSINHAAGDAPCVSLNKKAELSQRRPHDAHNNWCHGKFRQS